MTTATRAKPAETPSYESGWHYGGQDDRCVGEYAGTVCTHPFHTAPEPVGGAVNAETFAAKDTPNGASTPGAPAAPPPLVPDLAVLRAVVEETSRAVAAWLDVAQEIEALDVLAVVRQARQDLAQVEAVTEGRAARLMSGDTVEWPGGVAERRFGSTRKEWQHEDLIRTLRTTIAGELAADPSSGETDEMLAALLQDAISRFAVTHRPEWRVTALKAVGIDPDDYCHATPGRVSVQINTAGTQ